MKYLNNLAEIEERKLREDDLRREYRKQIDDYHISLRKPAENKVEKAQRLREKIRLEAEEVEMQRNHDEQVRKQRQSLYNNELGCQHNVNVNKAHTKAVMNAQLEANHTGLNIGQYKGVKTDLTQDLQKQILEKQEIAADLNRFRNDQSNPNDFLQYKDRFDDNNQNIVFENRRLMVHPDNNMAKEQQRGVYESEVRKLQVNNEEKLKDYEMMNNQVAHEKRILHEEYLRRANKGADLRSGLLDQMVDKERTGVHQVEES